VLALFRVKPAPKAGAPAPPPAAPPVTPDAEAAHA
jgi:hypothetical protein